MQIAWIDIASPELRIVHQEWIRIRGSKMMPTMADHQNFLVTAPVHAGRERSAALTIADHGAVPVFRVIGPAVAHLQGGCLAGDRITDMASMVDRVNVALPFTKIVSTRQPACRRQQPTARDAQGHEVLMLPFGDAGMRVRLIHAVYDLKGVDWKRFF
jgi:hypothetical protein